MRRVAIGSVAMLAMLAMLTAACGGSASSSSGTGSTTAPTNSNGATSTSAATPAGGLTKARFDSTNACGTLSQAQMVALVGGPLASAPQSHPGPGPIQCVFSASVNGASSPGSVQIAYFEARTGITPRSYIDGNERGYHPQAESGLGDYAIFDPSLGQTEAAKGPVALIVSGSPPGAAVSAIESAQAAAASAIFQSLGA